MSLPFLRKEILGRAERHDPADTFQTCQGQRHLNKSPMAIHNSDVERQAPLRHLDQAVFSTQIRSALTSAFAISMSLRNEEG
jgi:hypothetical protein